MNQQVTPAVLVLFRMYITFRNDDHSPIIISLPLLGFMAYYSERVNFQGGRPCIR